MNDLRSIARRFSNRDAWEDGLAFFEQLVADHPTDPDALANLAFFVVKQSRYDTERGLHLLDASLQANPRCPLA